MSPRCRQPPQPPSVTLISLRRDVVLAVGLDERVHVAALAHLDARRERRLGARPECRTTPRACSDSSRPGSRSTRSSACCSSRRSARPRRSRRCRASRRTRCPCSAPARRRRCALNVSSIVFDLERGLVPRVRASASPGLSQPAAASSVSSVTPPPLFSTFLRPASMLERPPRSRRTCHDTSAGDTRLDGAGSFVMRYFAPVEDPPDERLRVARRSPAAAAASGPRPRRPTLPCLTRAASRSQRRRRRPRSGRRSPGTPGRRASASRRGTPCSRPSSQARARGSGGRSSPARRRPVASPRSPDRSAASARRGCRGRRARSRASARTAAPRARSPSCTRRCACRACRRAHEAVIGREAVAVGHLQLRAIDSRSSAASAGRMSFRCST